MSVNLMALLYLGVDALGVIKPLLTYLALDKHAATVSAKCFFQLRQLRRVRRSLDRESAATLVHVFVSSRIDYGNALFANATKSTTDKLQRVLNAAARVISGTRKFDRGLSRIIRDDLGPTLAECFTTRHLQSVHDCLQVPTWLGTAIPR